MTKEYIIDLRLNKSVQPVCKCIIYDLFPTETVQYSLKHTRRSCALYEWNINTTAYCYNPDEKKITGLDL